MRRSLLLSVFVAIILTLTGCSSGKTGPPGPGKTELGDKNISGTVTDRKQDCLIGCWIIVTTSNGTLARIDIDAPEWAKCDVGDPYPACTREPYKRIPPHHA